jgi:4-hydroxy-tetrahydrodipicolinate synthase
VAGDEAVTLTDDQVTAVLFAEAKKRAEAAELYRWFLPLLRLDTVPEFVQLIKLVQAQVGQGSERVRPPRLPVQGALREQALSVIRQALAIRPAVAR